jgi:hypothetical protein
LDGAVKHGTSCVASPKGPGGPIAWARTGTGTTPAWSRPPASLNQEREGVTRTRLRVQPREGDHTHRVRTGQWGELPTRGRLGPQRIAFFTSAAIRASSAVLSFVSAQDVGHMLPSSRIASSSKPNVAYLDLNLSAALKKQTSLPSLA